MNGLIAFLTLYEIGHDVDRDVLPEVVAGDFHDPMIGSSPRPGGRPRVACDDDGLGAQQNVGRWPSGTHSLKASAAATPTTNAPAFRPAAFICSVWVIVSMGPSVQSNNKPGAWRDYIR
ncbi:MAG: hypothetical protein V3U22_03595 [Vicinamibacteria bacterium]